jgi:CBS domain-containing protein
MFDLINSLIERTHLHCPFIPLPSDAPLSDACEIFSKGVHRIPIVDENQKVTNVFTQSQFLKVNFSSKRKLSNSF